MKKWTLRLVLTAGAVAGLWLLGAGTAHAAGEESCFVSKINAARSKPLTVRSDLVTIARRHSARMAASGTIFHNGNLANEAPSDWQSLGENVGMGPTCDDIHNAFMNSASHRKNILDPDFNFVGVGVVISSDGTIFVTEVFMQASQPAPSQPAPTTTTTKTTTTRTRTTTSTPKAAPAPPPEPPPPPPPPPGSKVKGFTTAYFNEIEKESSPSVEEQAAYQLYLEQQAERKAALAAAELQRDARRQGLFSRIFAYIAAVMSGSI